MPDRSLFRQADLEKLSSPEQLDQMIEITDRKGWLACAAIGLLLATAVFWGIFGSVPIKVNGQGILVKPGGVKAIRSGVFGTVKEIHASVGDQIEKGHLVAVVEERIQPDSPRFSQRIHSPHEGRIVEVSSKAGMTVQATDPLLVLEESVGELEALVYVPAEKGKRIQSGMTAQISPSTVKREEYGFVIGRVERVGDVPATPEAMLQSLSNNVVVGQLLEKGPVIEVNVRLETSSVTPTGLRWSSSRGPGIRVTSGTLCAASFVVERKQPVSLVIPKLRKLTGIY